MTALSGKVLGLLVYPAVVAAWCALAVVEWLDERRAR